jgi:hypothetical protein
MESTNQKCNYYKPTLIHENPLALDEEDISYAKELLELSDNNNGFIPVKLEQDVVVQRISHDLYAKPESGFRELYLNEVRACMSAKKTFRADPSIVISLDPNSRELQIHGVNSIGISIDTFKNIYTFIGRSDNFSGEVTGQFGFGKISYSTLSDIMILETRYRTVDGKTGEYSIMGKNGVGYNILPKPTLDSFGTKVKLVLRPEINLQHLIEYIKEACVFSSIPTYLNLSEDLLDPGVTWRKEVLHRKGNQKLNKSYEERAEEAAKKSYYYSGESRASLVKSFLIQIDGAELYGEFRVRVKERRYYTEPQNVLHIGKDTRLIGAPIDAKVDFPFSYFILNVLNERKFAPTTDRERLREESVEALLALLKPKIAEAISSYLNISTFEQFRELDEGSAAILLSEKTGRGGDDDPNSITHYLSEQTKILRIFLLQQVKVYKDKETSRRYKQRNLASIIKEREPKETFFTPFGSKFNSAQIDKILQEIPSAVFIQLALSSERSLLNTDTVEDLLREYGILSTSEFIEENKERLASKPRHRAIQDSINIFESIEGYYSWHRFSKATRHVESIEADHHLPKNVIRVRKGSLKKYASFLSLIKTTYKLVQDRPELKGGIKLEDFLASLENKELVTSKGTKKFNDLLLSSNKSNIQLYLYCDPALANFFFSQSEEGELKIFASEDTLFELALFLTYHLVDFSLDTEMGELFDSEIKKDQSYSPTLDISRRNLLRDYSWPKLGDSEILGSVIHVFKEVSDDDLRFLFAKAVEGSKEPSEVAMMRKAILARWRDLSHDKPDALVSDSTKGDIASNF